VLVVQVLAIGAVIELDGRGRRESDVVELRADMQPRDGGYGPIPAKMLRNRRDRLAEASIPHLHAVEFAELSDGRRVVLRDDRGWCHWPPNTATSRWRIANGREIVKMAILILDPDDNDDWERWVAEQLRMAGIDVDAASVHAAPYRVELGPRLQHELRQLADNVSPMGTPSRDDIENRHPDP